MSEKLKGLAQRAGIATGATGFLVMLSMFVADGANAVEGDDPVTPAFTDLGTKITTYGAAIVGLVVLSVGIFMGIKYLRKGANKA